MSREVREQRGSPLHGSRRWRQGSEARAAGRPAAACSNRAAPARNLAGNANHACGSRRSSDILGRMEPQSGGAPMEAAGEAVSGGAQ